MEDMMLCEPKDKANIKSKMKTNVGYEKQKRWFYGKQESSCARPAACDM